MTTALALADLHAESFDAPWSQAAFADLLAQPGVWAVMEMHGFILMRVVADEAEVLALSVRPAHRRGGVATRLLGQAMVRAVAEGATRVFLEVAADNMGAQALYAHAGFAQVGLRPRYYARACGERVDALLLAHDTPERLP